LYFHKAGYPPSLNIFSSVASSFFSSMNVKILSPLLFGCRERQGRKRSEQKSVEGFGEERIFHDVLISVNSPRREPLTVSSRNGGAHLCDSAYPADLLSLWVDFLTRVPLPPS
jgi:hypothetical protein